MTTPDTVLRERLAKALLRAWPNCDADEGWHNEDAGKIVAALGPDATRMAAALGEGAVVVTVEDVARRMWDQRADYAPDGYWWPWDRATAEQREPDMAEARRLLGIEDPR